MTRTSAVDTAIDQSACGTVNFLFHLPCVSRIHFPESHANSPFTLIIVFFLSLSIPASIIQWPSSSPLHCPLPISGTVAVVFSLLCVCVSCKKWIIFIFFLLLLPSLEVSLFSVNVGPHSSSSSSSTSTSTSVIFCHTLSYTALSTSSTLDIIYIALLVHAERKHYTLKKRVSESETTTELPLSLSFSLSLPQV